MQVRCFSYRATRTSFALAGGLLRVGAPSLRYLGDLGFGEIHTGVGVASPHAYLPRAKFMGGRRALQTGLDSGAQNGEHGRVRSGQGTCGKGVRRNGTDVGDVVLVLPFT